MKILFAVPYFYPKVGGVETYSFNMAEGLKKKYNHEIVVVTSNHVNRKLMIVEFISGIKIYRLPYWFKLSNTPINPLWYFMIKNIINKEKPNIINAHSPVPFMADVTSRVCGSVPFVVTYHAASLYKYGNSLFNIFIWLYKKIENHVFQKAQIIMVVSEFLRGSFVDKLKSKIYIVSNFIKEEEIQPRKTSKFKKNNDVIFIGQLDKTHAWKGLDQIILAIKNYTEIYSVDIKLIVIGDGNWKETYIDQAKKLNLEKYIDFVGKRVGREKNQLLQDAKILISYPYTANDAFPTVFLEAWAKEIPIISSNIGSIPGIIDNYVNGILIEPNSPKKLAKALDSLLNNEKQAKRLGENGLRKVKEYYTLDKQLKNVNSLFNKIVQKQKLI